MLVFYYRDDGKENGNYYFGFWFCSTHLYGISPQKVGPPGSRCKVGM